MRILLIDDEKDLIDVLKPSLEAACYVVDVATDGTQGSFLARTNRYDLIILDHLLPGKNGETVVKEIREEKNATPVLMLSAVQTSENKISLLNSGADDYLTKPFVLEELMARIRAILRRPPLVQEDVLRIDNVTLDSRRQTVQRATRDIYLTRKEFMLLEYFLRNPGLVLSRSMIMEHVWDMNLDPFSNTIEAHILSLRKKLKGPGERELIRTVPGRGYKLEVH